MQLTATSYFLAGSNEQSSERRSWRAVNASANKPDHSKNPKKLECSACNTIPTQYTCIRLYAQLRCKYLSLIYIFPFSFKFAACWDATLSDLYNELSELREREKKKHRKTIFNSSMIRSFTVDASINERRLVQINCLVCAYLSVHEFRTSQAHMWVSTWVFMGLVLFAYVLNIMSMNI